MPPLNMLLQPKGAPPEAPPMMGDPMDAGMDPGVSADLATCPQCGCEFDPSVPPEGAQDDAMMADVAADQQAVS